MGLQVLVSAVVRFYPVMGHLSNAIFLALAKGPQTEVKKMVNPTIDLLLPVWVTGPTEQVSGMKCPLGWIMVVNNYCFVPLPQTERTRL